MKSSLSYLNSQHKKDILLGNQRIELSYSWVQIKNEDESHKSSEKFVTPFIFNYNDVHFNNAYQYQHSKMAGIAVVVGEEMRNYLLELWVEIV